ncbi:MAG: hypothetical protein AB7O86_05605 [Porticoccaceae bacterium]
MKNRIAHAIAGTMTLIGVLVLSACDPTPGPVPPIPGYGGAGGDTAALTTYQHPNPNVEQWHAAAIHAGWSEAEWPVVSCIMEHPVHKNVAESRGDPNAYNGRGVDRSYGLMQLNTKAASMRNWYYAAGLNMVQDLWDGVTNLIFAKKLADYNASASWAGFNKWWPWKGGSIRAECFRMEGLVNA